MAAPSFFICIKWEINANNSRMRPSFQGCPRSLVAAYVFNKNGFSTAMSGKKAMPCTQQNGSHRIRN